MALTDLENARPPVRRTALRSGFAMGWLTITLATALVFAAFAGPLIQNGHAAALSDRLAGTASMDLSLVDLDGPRD